MMNENEINYNELQVDKENTLVSYNDKLHKYWTKDTKQNCISVTTLIHNFTTFDELFWSAYKTLESLLSKDEFKLIKSTLLSKKVFDYSILEKVGISKEDFDIKKAEILEEWRVKRDESCVRGNAIHKQREDGHLVGETPEIKQLGLGGSFKPNVTNRITLGERAVYPEILLSYISKDGTFRLAGQADLVIIDNNDLYLLDYKSNKEIKKKSYYDFRNKKSEMMKYPLNNLEDANFWHYTIQLSTYAWMIKQANPGVIINKLILIHYDHEGNCTPYECEYLEKDVEKMLKFYKREMEYAAFKNSRAKIKF